MIIVLYNCIGEQMSSIIPYDMILYHTQHAIGRNFQIMTCRTLIIQRFVVLRLEYNPKVIAWFKFVLYHSWYTQGDLTTHCRKNDKEIVEYVLHIYQLYKYRWIWGQYDTMGFISQLIIHTNRQVVLYNHQMLVMLGSSIW